MSITLAIDGDVSPVEDVVFSRYKADNTLADAFALNLFLSADASVIFEELPIPIPGGGEIGERIFSLAAEIKLFQTSLVAAKSIILHDSFLWHVSILYQNLNVVSSVFLDASGKKTKVNTDTLNRYNNINDFRDEFGLGLRFSDTAQGNDRELHIIGKGATCEKYDWHVSSLANFYKCFTLPGGTGVLPIGN